MNKKRFTTLPEPEIVETVRPNGQKWIKKVYKIVGENGETEKFHSIFEYQRKKRTFTEQGIRFVLNNLPDHRQAEKLFVQMEKNGQADCVIGGVNVTLKLFCDEDGGQLLEIFAADFVLPKTNPKFVRPGEYKFDKQRTFVKTCRDVYRLVNASNQKK